MTPEILTLFAVLVLAVVLFSIEAVTVDVTGALVLLALFFTRILGPDEIFRGFGNEVILFLGSLFVVSEALMRTGALEPVESLLTRLAERRPGALLLVMASGAGAVSAFLSNTATMAAILPVAVGLCRKLRIAPSKLLMPLAFGSILGGVCTLVGTSTNIVVSGLLPSYGLDPLGLFELAPVGLPILVLGLAYLATVGRTLLPERGGEPLDTYGVRAYLGEVVVPGESPWAGKTLAETEAGRELDVTVIGLVGEEHEVHELPPWHRLAPGDVLLVEASPEKLLRLKERKELDLVADRDQKEDRRSEPIQVHELVLAPHSRLAGRSLREHGFRSRYGVTALALYRRGASQRERIAETRLRDGDVLLVQGDLSRLEWLLRSGDLLLLERTEVQPRRRRAWLVLAVFLAMLLAGGMGWLSFGVAAFAAAATVIVTGCLSSSEAYSAVDWRILVMVACLLSLAAAMESTGAAEYLALRIVEATRELGPLALLAGFYLLTMALSQPMSNQAAALVVLPLAIRTAVELGLNPRAFAVTVALAASCSFITPLEPASLLVYGPGRYRFRDFFIVGLPLTLVVLAVTLLVVPRLWPL